jgi:subtilase family serine protease
MSYHWSVLIRRRGFSFLTFSILLTFIFAGSAQAQAADPASPLDVQPRDRITSFIDDEQRVTLTGNRHPLAQAQYDKGPVAPDFPMEHMLLTLLPDSAQQEALDQLVAAQHNPGSPYYHQWLTPEQFAERFGVSEGDTAQIAGWLLSHGMEVEEITAGRRTIIFSGTAGQVQQAFHTEIHIYNVGNEVHHANATDPEIPAALAQVVGGVVSLHDFYSAPLHLSPRKASSPEFTSGGSHYLAPADFATIYDLAPAYQAAITGSGQSIAIVARSNIKMSDVQQFRSYFALPANNPQIIVNGADPGVFSSDEETEADLDAEWSGAVAKAATIKFVVSKSTNSSDGVNLSAQYIVNNNLAPVMSTSFGLCEASLGSTGNSFFNALWQQAAAEGITAFISSGDNGAAGCDSASATTATHGLGVNGLCSSPYSVCVGGTEFSDSNASLYWSSFNAAGSQGSALSYIPEVVWNESSSGGLWAGGGGSSSVYSKPSWQSGTGVPADGKRDVPDVSLTAAGHDGYLIYQEGGMYVVGGTSAASPSFAGLMALVVQNTAARHGNANTVFYPLATKQRSGGAVVFHDITVGNNSVPGQTGYTAKVGYDQASGLGSVDASVLVNHWSDGIVVPGFALAPSASSVSVIAGSSGSVTVNVTVSGGFKSAVVLTITGLPSGVSAAFSPTTLPSPGSGSSALKLTATSSAAPGVHAATVTGTSGSTIEHASISVTVEAAPTFTLTPSATSLSVAPGSSKTLTLMTAPTSGFSAAISLSVTGLPSGVTAVFTPATIGAPGSGSSSLKLTAGSRVKAGNYTATVSATSGSTKKQVLIGVSIS